jgi:mannose-6-phosphate isomerase-like protein (cupin superfamily)
MIRKAEEMVKVVKEQMRGGIGSVEFTHIFKQEELTGKARLLAKISINPGCSIGMHEHVNEEEIYYILKGKGIVEDNGVRQEVNIGDAVLTGGGACHFIENTGDETLEFMAVILLY